MCNFFLIKFVYQICSFCISPVEKGGENAITLSLIKSILFAFTLHFVVFSNNGQLHEPIFIIFITEITITDEQLSRKEVELGRAR